MATTQTSRRASQPRRSPRRSTGRSRTESLEKRSSSRWTRWRSQSPAGIENRTEVGWELAPGAIAEGSFGLQLFEKGDKDELDQRNQRRTLPAVRAATGYEPELPRILEPKASWDGTISAHGPLVAGSWARVAFGTLIAVGKPPEGLEERFVWITDNAYRLRA